jgi:hypothetical protein
VVPRLTALRQAMAGYDVEVDVRRLQPLSLVFRLGESQDVTFILAEALKRILEEQRELITTG